MVRGGKTGEIWVIAELEVYSGFFRRYYKKVHVKQQNS
nr:MAG TPA: 14-3-3 protein zeta/delta [Caudoviricetes sp.]